MKSGVTKRALRIGGHKTSVSLEDSFWVALKEIGRSRETTPSQLVAEIAAANKQGNLSSATRIFVLGYFQNKPNRDGIE